MLRNSLTFLLITLSIVYSAVMIYPLKEGDSLELTLGTGVRTWNRQVKSGEKQTTKYCGPTEKNVSCGQWVDSNGKPVKGGEVSVGPDGTLRIPKVTVADSGAYSSPDELVRTQKVEGGFVATPQSLITVEVSPR